MAKTSTRCCICPIRTWRITRVSSSAPVQAGTYKVFASFDGNASYNAVASFDTGRRLQLAKVNPQFNIMGAAATFDGNPHAATGTATGVLGENSRRCCI